LIAAVATNWQAFLPTAPVVEVDGLDAAPPLWSAFYIRNESFIFPLRITWLGCRIITIEPATTTKGDVDLWVGTNVADYGISPFHRILMMCKIKPGEGITRLKMQVLIQYTHVGPITSGGTASITLNWMPNHWTVGNIMK
jgi:hypothetical protein